MLTNAVGQPTHHCLDDRHRGQARSHILDCVGREILRQAQISVGAGLPAMAVGQSDYLLLIHRIREQARSHSWDCAEWEILRQVQISVGAGLPAMAVG